MATPVIENRKARHDYHVGETYEVGVMLVGTEVKSVRMGKLSLGEAFAIIRSGELYLVNAHIDEYTKGNVFNHEVRRERKLLAHRKEIDDMDQAVTRKGLTLIPLKGYFKGDVLKLLIGICKGKADHDKRADKLKREAQRDMDRALRNANR